MPISHIAPNNVDRIDELIKSARANIIKIIETRLKISNFEELIETEIINDPRTWQSKFNLWKGSILGLSHNITQVLHMRPGTRSHLFKNLYFVGASAHPVCFKFWSRHTEEGVDLFLSFLSSLGNWCAGGSMWLQIGWEANYGRCWNDRAHRWLHHHFLAVHFLCNFHCCNCLYVHWNLILIKAITNPFLILCKNPLIFI